MVAVMNKVPTIGAYSDAEEKELIASLEAEGAIFESKLTSTRKKEIQALAHATMNARREKITLRISHVDLARLKSRAMQDGMPYQTLINSILHKAVSS
jgi:predicted DNA binding CopG/RHH family protein